MSPLGHFRRYRRYWSMAALRPTAEESSVPPARCNRSGGWHPSGDAADAREMRGARTGHPAPMGLIGARLRHIACVPQATLNPFHGGPMRVEAGGHGPLRLGSRLHAVLRQTT